MTRTRVLVLAVLAALVVGGLVWRPWDAPREPVRGIVEQMETVPGVLEVEGGGDLPPGWRYADETSFVELVVRLDPALAPADAQRATDAAVAAARLPEADEGAPLALVVTVTAGGTGADDAPVRLHAGTGVDGAPSDSTSPGDGPVATAFALRAAGATSVDDTTVVVPDGRTLVAAAALLEQRDHSPVGGAQSLRTADGAITYASGLVPREATARLLADTAALPGVTAVAFTWNQARPSALDVTVAGQDAAESDAVPDLLGSADEASVVTPTGFTVTGSGEPVTGWVAGLEPPTTVPHTVPLPGGVEPWPADPGAADCAAGDLTLTLGAPDAAAGSRYLAVHAQNVSDAPCALEGAPQLVFRNGDSEPQDDVRVVAASPGVVPGRVVVPAGAQAMATVQWRAMSTANDPDVTTTVEVTAVPGGDAATLTPELPDGAGPAELDVLDGAEVRVSPWVQAAEGWS